MIRRLKSSDIDFDIYRERISKACQPNFYAQPDVLNERCEAWEILEKDDYQYIMPLPLKKKWGRWFVLMPLFVQQLGIFSEKDDSEVNTQFLHFLKHNYNVYTYNFNAGNVFTGTFPDKKNYRISQTTYEDNYRKYFKGRKSAVKSAADLTFGELDLTEDVETFLRINFRGLEKRKDLLGFFRYLHFLRNWGSLKVFGVFENGRVRSVACITWDQKTSYLLALVNESPARSNAPSKLVDSLLKQMLAERDFDFMGGNIRGIEVFFKSFGAINQPYVALSYRKISLLKKMIFFR